MFSNELVCTVLSFLMISFTFLTPCTFLYSSAADSDAHKTIQTCACQYFSAFFNAASIVASGNIEDKQQAFERIGEMVYQQRTGHFRLNYRVLDGNRAIGVGVIEIEVLFKGRFSDVGLPAAPPA